MDPFSVAAACVGTLAGITQLASQITTFILSLDDAKDDMQAVLVQLETVQSSLEQLRDESTKVNYPEVLSRRFIDMVHNCDTVLSAMEQALDRVSKAKTSRRLQWTLTGKDEMAKLSIRLETHKTAVAVAVGIASLCLTAEIKIDTNQILQETAALHQQMGLMQLQMNSLHRSSSDPADNVLMQRFMEETTSYAESVLGDRDSSSDLLTHAIDEDNEVADVPPTLPCQIYVQPPTPPPSTSFPGLKDRIRDERDQRVRQHKESVEDNFQLSPCGGDKSFMTPWTIHYIQYSWNDPHMGYCPQHTFQPMRQNHLPTRASPPPPLSPRRQGPTHPGLSTPWTLREDSMLIDAKSQGLGWNEIHQRFFPNKSSNSCRKRHERLLLKLRSPEREEACA